MKVLKAFTYWSPQPELNWRPYPYHESAQSQIQGFCKNPVDQINAACQFYTEVNLIITRFP